MEQTWRTIAGVAVLGMALAAWLWPIGLGGQMPVSGDVTRFSIGLMAFLGESLRAWRLPLWNDLWGYGFPGVAESQMGVYYPPHWLLYGLLPVEVAYTLSLVLHTLWAGLGVIWSARRFGASLTGALLAAFAWTASGFYVIHLPHQWGYTTGSWMPWAWGLAWALAQGAGRPRHALLLTAVLAVQVLPGHFQLAFVTQLGVLLLAAWGLAARRNGRRAAIGNTFGILVAVGAIPLLAAAQVVPTYRLARLAESDRTFEYLSGFAASPLHLISYVAPWLFHGSPLWRPVVWDPFHTSPEEHLAYIGLAPLFLALGALVRGIRREPTTQALALVVVVTMLLSLGPYVPGFRLLIHLPGFSYFRAPARWALATQLALSLLAARGFDDLRAGAWRRVRPGLAAFVLTAATLVTLPVLMFEHALAVTGQPGDPAAVAVYDRLLGLLPWDGDPPFAAVLEAARRPSTNPIVQQALIRQGLDPLRARLDRERFQIYRGELLPSGLLLAGLLALAFVARRPDRLAAGLAVLALADLLAFGHTLRPVETGPIRPLTEQSTVLGRLAAAPWGARVASDLGNLPMVAGVAALPAYRTLDLPALTYLIRGGVAIGEWGAPYRPEWFDGSMAALRAAGVALNVAGPERTSTDPSILATYPGTVTTVLDPALTAWIHGGVRAASRGPSRSTFTIWEPFDRPPGRAWLLPLAEDEPEEAARRLQAIPGDSPNTMPLLEVLAGATPLEGRSPGPELVEVRAMTEGPAYLLVAQLYHPDWEAHLTGPDGIERPAPVEPLFASAKGRAVVGGWQGVRLPGPGRWTLTLEYSGRFERWGWITSGVAWAVWIVAYWRLGRTRKAGETEGGSR